MTEQVSRVGVLKISDVLLCEALGIPVGCNIVAVSHTDGVTVLTLEGPSLPVATDPPAEVKLIVEAPVPPPMTRWAHDVGTGLASADWPSSLPRPGIPVRRLG